MQTQQQKGTGCGLARLAVSGVLLVPLLVLSYIYVDYMAYANSPEDTIGYADITLFPLLVLMLLNVVPIFILTVINMAKNMYAVTSLLLFCLSTLVAVAGIISFTVWG